MPGNPNQPHASTKFSYNPPNLAPQEWLNTNIRGSLDPSGDDLMQAVTGSKLKPSVFLQHLRSKYSQLYKLP